MLHTFTIYKYSIVAFRGEERGKKAKQREGNRKGKRNKKAKQEKENRGKEERQKSEAREGK